MEIMECLRKHGQRLDVEIAEETGMAIANVRERLAAMASTGAVIVCKVTRFERGTASDACLYRVAGYAPPRSAGRKPTRPA
jgi:transcription initiation factor IIE alpha subunit